MSVPGCSLSDMATLHVDCDGCTMRGPACGDCVMSVLLGPPGSTADFVEEEQEALDVLARAGLVPPLRMVSGTGPDRGVEPFEDRLRVV